MTIDTVNDSLRNIDPSCTCAEGRPRTRKARASGRGLGPSPRARPSLPPLAPVPAPTNPAGREGLAGPHLRGHGDLEHRGATACDLNASLCRHPHGEPGPCLAGPSAPNRRPTEPLRQPAGKRSGHPGGHAAAPGPGRPTLPHPAGTSPPPPQRTSVGGPGPAPAGTPSATRGRPQTGPRPPPQAVTSDPPAGSAVDRQRPREPRRHVALRELLPLFGLHPNSEGGQSAVSGVLFRPLQQLPVRVGALHHRPGQEGGDCHGPSRPRPE